MEDFLDRFPEGEYGFSGKGMEGEKLVGEANFTHVLPALAEIRRFTQAPLAGVIYIAGAVGVEIFGNSLSVQSLRDTLQYNMATLAEESLEMLGVILFIQALLRYMRGSAATVEASLSLS